MLKIFNAVERVVEHVHVCVRYSNFDIRVWDEIELLVHRGWNFRIAIRVYPR